MNFRLRIDPSTKRLLSSLAVTVIAAISVGFEGFPDSLPVLKSQTDAHWTSNVPGYYLESTNGQFVWNTNTEQYWKGIWQEGAHGWRVQLRFLTNDPPFTMVTVEIGSTTTNSGQGYFTAPNRKFSKFELLATNGVVVRPKWGASLESKFPEKLSAREFPIWHGGDDRGALIVRFFSNGPPNRLDTWRLNDLYSIRKEGDFVLTVCPVLYKQEANQTNFDRVELPCVTTKVHLLPH